MEQNLPITVKKFWNTVRVLYFMLRKGLSKARILADVSMMIKRGMIARRKSGHAQQHNIMFHHATASLRRSHADRNLSYVFSANEYEFSCSNTPAYTIFNLNKKKHAAAALETINSAAASPALPG